MDIWLLEDGGKLCDVGEAYQGTCQPGHENDFYAWVQRALAARERFPGHQGVTLLITF